MEADLLGGGLRNPNYRLHLAGDPRPVVLRLYTADTAACAREVSLMGLVGERVPVPRSEGRFHSQSALDAVRVDGRRALRQRARARVDARSSARLPLGGRSPRRH
jgi:hypothetical protein